MYHKYINGIGTFWNLGQRSEYKWLSHDASHYLCSSYWAHTSIFRWFFPWMPPTYSWPVVDHVFHWKASVGPGGRGPWDPVSVVGFRDLSISWLSFDLTDNPSASSAGCPSSWPWPVDWRLLWRTWSWSFLFIVHILFLQKILVPRIYIFLDVLNS